MWAPWCPQTRSATSADISRNRAPRTAYGRVPGQSRCRLPSRVATGQLSKEMDSFFPVQAPSDAIASGEFGVNFHRSDSNLATIEAGVAEANSRVARLLLFPV